MKFTDKVEITYHTLGEVNRAFNSLIKNKESYIYKVFSDDGVFFAIDEIKNKLNEIERMNNPKLK
jgi:hypothetical protein